jgi:hypothetical protein
VGAALEAPEGAGEEVPEGAAEGVAEGAGVGIPDEAVAPWRVASAVTLASRLVARSVGRTWEGTRNSRGRPPASTARAVAGVPSGRVAEELNRGTETFDQGAVRGSPPPGTITVIPRASITRETPVTAVGPSGVVPDTTTPSSLRSSVSVTGVIVTSPFLYRSHRP